MKLWLGQPVTLCVNFSVQQFSLEVPLTCMTSRSAFKFKILRCMCSYLNVALSVVSEPICSHVLNQLSSYCSHVLNSFGDHLEPRVCVTCEKK